MELYACGFNAWDQLKFKEIIDDEPRDIFKFECILKDDSIQVLNAGFTGTVVKTCTNLQIAGKLDNFATYVSKNPGLSSLLSEAGNGRIAYVHNSHRAIIQEFASWKGFPDQPQNTWELGHEIKHVVSGDTFFAALTENGTVWTWGDERYGACLGREISAECPACEPRPIIDLQSLPCEGTITKICSSGYISAALTSSHDLYFWGIDRDGSLGLSLTYEPSPLDLEGLDILDVGVGERHLIVLTEDAKVWVRGEGANGQLGLQRAIERVEEWRAIDLGSDKKNEIEKAKDREAVGVVAGPKSSFVLVRAAHQA